MSIPILEAALFPFRPKMVGEVDNNKVTAKGIATAGHSTMRLLSFVKHVFDGL